MATANKVVVVTGGSSGIGRATAKLLAEAGAFVVLGSREEGPLVETVDAITAAGGRGACKVTDVRRRADVDALVAFAIKEGGCLDVIVNSAGIGPISRFDALKVDDWEAMIDVNLRGTLYGIAAALPVFQRRKSGHIVNIISTAGIALVPTMGVYAATKNAVRAATEVLRQEAGPDLRVTEISPGVVDTGFSDKITDEPTRKMLEQRLGGIAIPPDAIARGVLFAIDQPPEVDVGSIVIRPTAQG